MPTPESFRNRGVLGLPLQQADSLLLPRPERVVRHFTCPVEVRTELPLRGDETRDVLPPQATRRSRAIQR
ncbi:hypothetical protein [Streptomyces sp. NPDC004435]|uniref:hypothetical protein n=1 Tax=Streptomyces sp. NPDC004435 TaxID=3364701 RepID=UPI0036BE70FB